jgi:hypothetical protein
MPPFDDMHVVFIAALVLCDSLISLLTDKPEWGFALPN